MGIFQQARELARPAEAREALAQRVSASLGETDGQRVRALEELVTRMAEELSVEDRWIKLRRLLFGPKTETTRNLLEDKPDGSGSGDPDPEKPKPKTKGHGRNGKEKYPGAKVICVKHPDLKPGQKCPKCGRGNLLELKPAVEISIKARPPIEATQLEKQRLRCALCGMVFTAPTPPGVPNTKYDPGVGVMLGLMRFGFGTPHYRLARMQEMFGVPMPESTQWSLMAEAQRAMKPVMGELAAVAAQGSLFHIDDTKMRVQELTNKGGLVEAEGAKKGKERKGVFTASIQSFGPGWQVGLYFTGNQYAAERMEILMTHRAPGLATPIQMSDAFSWNGSRKYPFIEALCLVHGRREFVDLISSFPEASRRVLEDLRTVYGVDSQARESKMSPEARLTFHQERSGPIMADLKSWMEEQLALKLVEPNSGLGKAMRYMLKHWQGLTLFLRLAGAPLDNSIAERAIKRAVLHRKNSLSYLTKAGAEVGDTVMSLIETCRMNGVNPHAYMMALVTHAEAVAKCPGDWLPWNYPRPPIPAATAD